MTNQSQMYQCTLESAISKIPDAPSWANRICLVQDNIEFGFYDDRCFMTFNKQDCMARYSLGAHTPILEKKDGQWITA